MKIEEVEQCSFQNWYNNFKNVSVKSIILPLPDDFIKYILADGIILPKSTNVSHVVSTNDSDLSDEEETWEEDTDEAEPEAPYFPEFDQSIENAIESLGGKVFPKLNWSSPKDASWMGFNYSCCSTSISDIYLLLKSSNFIIHDITQPYNLCDDFIQDQSLSEIEQKNIPLFLVLRKWIDIDTSGEFRCFVKENKLIGVCQREHSAFFEHINLHKAEILEDLVTFFTEKVQFKFPLPNYIYDVYRKKKDKVILIDFNPFGKVTDSLLFTWEELNSDLTSVDENDEYPEFRCVEDNYGVQPRTLSSYAVPTDIIDISTGEDSFKLVDLMKLKIEAQNESSDDENNAESNGTQNE
ncbi:translation initiation factor eIF2 assembly protein isoform X1 [Parasteatoda tepidariorum]|uniref:translation initiation factor eIF2 assembly protein isoform X1 n=1 Tax=Parasteatoda tepidariorum TaxID=114398 RepID=UPI001C71EC08|nr:cell division cycle protein 123 homolog isoform X1 [Parasteatoda tepidariorum]